MHTKKTVQLDKRKLTFSYKAAGKKLGVCSRTISRAVAKKQIKAVTIGGKKRIPLAELERIGGLAQ